MPPIYSWVSDSTGKEYDILRSFEEYLDPPNEEEAPEDKGPFRKIVKAVATKRGPNWGPGKGYYGR